uniref:Uncharacterized protein n=1 Tax=Meloidogyne incognita TaxID=6306 RepID=A0A914L3D8_MELIC
MECGNGRACEMPSINGRWSEWSDWSSNCEWSGCIGFDPKNDLDIEEKNDSIQQFFGRYGETGDDIIEDELASENNITLINALAHAQLARTLNIRTRTRTCYGPTLGGIPCFGIASQKSLCPIIESKNEKCINSSISQLLAHIWNADFSVLQFILKL